MASLYSIHLIVLLLVAYSDFAFLFGGFDYEYEIDQTDQYVDNIIKDMVQEFDPHHLEDIQMKYTVELDPKLDAIMDVNLYKGNLRGLKTMKRVSQCTVDREFDKFMAFAELDTGPLKMMFDGTIKFKFGDANSIQSTLVVNARVEKIEVEMDFAFDKEGGQLVRFSIESIKNVSCAVRFKLAKGKLANDIIQDWVADYMKNYTKNWFETSIKNYFAEKISTNPLNLENFN